VTARRHELIEHLIAGALPDCAFNLIDIARVGKLFGEGKRFVGDTRPNVVDLLAGTPQIRFGRRALQRGPIANVVELEIELD
jgi:hypothetical protein